MAKGPARHPMVRLKGPGRPERVEDLLLPRYTVGRGDAARPGTVEFEVKDDPYLSRQHCVLVRAGDGYAVENLSANGTYLNGKTIDARVTLKPGDRVAVGEGTTLEYLLLDDEERAKALHLEAGEAAQREAAAGKPPKGKGNKRLVWTMLGVYGLIALVILAAMGGDEEAASTDPGKGPYFASLLTVRLSGIKVADDPRPLAEAMWRRALSEHAGPFAGTGAHDWYLVQAGLRTLSAMGYTSLTDALAKGEPVAKETKAALDRLEQRVSDLHQEAGRLGRNGHLAAALTRLERILDAVPDHDAPIRRFAYAKVRSLRERLR